MNQSNLFLYLPRKTIRKTQLLGISIVIVPYPR